MDTLFLVALIFEAFAGVGLVLFPAALLGPLVDTRKPNPCSGVTVDLNGSIWLAGRKANTHSLFKVVQKPKDGSCVNPWVELPAVPQDLPNTVDTQPNTAQDVPTYCAREYAFGRPVLVDINPVDGEVAANFTAPGIVGLEERKTAVFFPDELDINGNPLQPVEIASGKTEWGLVGIEQLLSAAFLQIQATDRLPLGTHMEGSRRRTMRCRSDSPRAFGRAVPRACARARAKTTGSFGPVKSGYYYLTLH